MFTVLSIEKKINKSLVKQNLIIYNDLDRIDFDTFINWNEQEKLLNHLLIRQLLDGLSEKEQQIIILRYYKEKTQTEVARMLGISQVQVSRMEKKILLYMREKIVNDN